MKKFYEKPELEVLLLDVEAVKMDLYCNPASKEVTNKDFIEDAGTWDVLSPDHFVPDP